MKYKQNVLFFVVYFYIKKVDGRKSNMRTTSFDLMNRYKNFS